MTKLQKYQRLNIELAEQYQQLVKEIRDNTRRLLRYWSEVEREKEKAHQEWNLPKFIQACQDQAYLRSIARDLQTQAYMIGLEINM